MAPNLGTHSHILSSLNRLLDWRLVSLSSLNDDTLGGDDSLGALAASISMQLEQTGQIETGLLQHLDLADVDIVERIDSLAGLLNVLGDRVGQQLVDHLLQIGRRDVPGDDVVHLGADLADLRSLGVAGLALGHRVLGGESDAEDAQQVSVGGLDINVGLDQRLPLLDHRSECTAEQ